MAENYYRQTWRKEPSKSVCSHEKDKTITFSVLFKSESRSSDSEMRDAHAQHLFLSMETHLYILNIYLQSPRSKNKDYKKKDQCIKDFISCLVWKIDTDICNNYLYTYMHVISLTFHRLLNNSSTEFVMCVF